MKKTIIAVFSVSITAGTIYWSYSYFKGVFIKKLVASWIAEGKKQNKELDEKYLSGELDKLLPWDLKLVADLSSGFMHQAALKVLDPLAKKAIDRDIFKKINLVSVSGICLPR